MSLLKISLGVEEFTPPEGGVFGSSNFVFEKEKKKTHTPQDVLNSIQYERWKKAFGGKPRTRKYLLKKIGGTCINGSLQNNIRKGFIVRLRDDVHGRGQKQIFKWVGNNEKARRKSNDGKYKEAV